MPKRTQQTAAPLIPAKPTIPKLRVAATNCHACDLWKTGTQTVFGEGGSKPRVMLVGEQPGDQEDLQGRPFVGPAGKLLDKALAEADIDREALALYTRFSHIPTPYSIYRGISKLRPGCFLTLSESTSLTKTSLDVRGRVRKPL